MTFLKKDVRGGSGRSRNPLLTPNTDDADDRNNTNVCIVSGVLSCT